MFKQHFIIIFIILTNYFIQFEVNPIFDEEKINRVNVQFIPESVIFVSLMLSSSIRPIGIFVNN